MPISELLNVKKTKVKKYNFQLMQQTFNKFSKITPFQL